MGLGILTFVEKIVVIHVKASGRECRWELGEKPEQPQHTHLPFPTQS